MLCLVGSAASGHNSGVPDVLCCALSASDGRCPSWSAQGRGALLPLASSALPGSAVDGALAWPGGTCGLPAGAPSKAVYFEPSGHACQWLLEKPSTVSRQPYTVFLSLCLVRTRAQIHSCALVQYYDVHVWFVAHPRQMRDWKGEPPTMYDISGSAHFINKADNGVVVHRNRNPDKGPMNEVGSCSDKGFEHFHRLV